jgi:hypothetical protein
MLEKINNNKETNKETEGRETSLIHNIEANSSGQDLITNMPSAQEIGVHSNYSGQNMPSISEPVFNPNQPYANYHPANQQPQQTFYGQNFHPPQIYQQTGYPQQGGYFPQNQPQYAPLPPNPGNNIIFVQQPVSPQYILISNNTEGYPRLSKTNAIVILLLNIFFCGLGSIVMGCISPGAEGFICIGILQILLAPVLLIGWIWSIITGLNVLKYARQEY